MGKFVRCVSLCRSLGKERREKKLSEYSRVYERVVCRLFLSRYTIFQYFARREISSNRGESGTLQMFNRRIFREEYCESLRSAARKSFRANRIARSRDSRDLLREQKSQLAIPQRDIREAVSAERERARHPSRAGWRASISNVVIIHRAAQIAGCFVCETYNWNRRCYWRHDCLPAK